MNEPLTDHEKDALAAFQKAVAELPETLSVSVNRESIIVTKHTHQGYLSIPSKSLKVTFVALADPLNKKTQYRKKNPLELLMRPMPAAPSAIALASNRCHLTPQEAARLETEDGFPNVLDNYLPELD